MTTAIDWAKIHATRTFLPVTPALALFSFLYGLGVRLRRIAFGRIKKKTLPGFVVSIGNLTVGGTGKTPAVCMLAEWALGEGYRVAILSRGYGGRYKTRVFEVSDGNDIKAGPVEGGDEAYLLAKKLPGVPVIISKKRYWAGLLTHKKFGTNFFILDDGFQHLALKRDLDLVLIDASTPFGNGHLLPWGPLREPVTGLKRADAFIVTRFDEDHSGDDLMGLLHRQFPDQPLFRSDHTPKQIVFPGRKFVDHSGFLKGKRVIAFAGIARPEVFKETLIRLGVELVFFKGFEDHHSFHPEEIQDLMIKKGRLKADYLLTTEKDWVRMETLLPEYPDLAYLTITFTLLTGMDAFFRMVKDRIGKIRNS